MGKDNELDERDTVGCLGMAAVLLGLLIGCVALGMFLGAAYGLAAVAAVVLLTGCLLYTLSALGKKKEAKRDGE